MTKVKNKEIYSRDEQTDLLSSLTKYQNLFLGLVLTHLDEPFERFQENKIIGSPIFDLSCDELVEQVRRKKELAAQSGDEDNQKQVEIKDKINQTILILLISIYAQAIKIAGGSVIGDDNNITFTHTMPIAIQYTLSRDENQNICEKITKLSSLTNHTAEKLNQDFLLELATSKFDQAKKLFKPVAPWAIGYAMSNNIEDNQEVTKAEFARYLTEGQKVANTVENTQERLRRKEIADLLCEIQKYN